MQPKLGCSAWNGTCWESAMLAPPEVQQNMIGLYYWLPKNKRAQSVLENLCYCCFVFFSPFMSSSSSPSDHQRFSCPLWLSKVHSLVPSIRVSLCYPVCVLLYPADVVIQVMSFCVFPWSSDFPFIAVKFCKPALTRCFQCAILTNFIRMKNVYHPTFSRRLCSLLNSWDTEQFLLSVLCCNIVFSTESVKFVICTDTGSLFEYFYFLDSFAIFSWRKIFSFFFFCWRYQRFSAEIVRLGNHEPNVDFLFYVICKVWSWKIWPQTAFCRT